MKTLLVPIKHTSQKAMWSQGWHDHFFHMHREVRQPDKQRESERQNCERTRDHLAPIPGSRPL